MIKTNRRNVLAGAAALALNVSAASANHDGKPDEEVVVDVTALNAEPAYGDMVLGKADAKVTLIEYASASCPHCAAFANEVLPAFQKDFIDTGKVRFVLREFPHNDAAMGAFMVARCAPKEKYFPILDVMFKTQEKWVPNPLEGLKGIALQAGFTEDSFMACLNNKELAKNIFDVREKGSTFGVQGIPTFFVNGVRYKGENTLEGLKAVIDPLLG